jgi:hypothetical protein
MKKNSAVQKSLRGDTIPPLTPLRVPAKTQRGASAKKRRKNGYLDNWERYKGKYNAETEHGTPKP